MTPVVSPSVAQASPMPATLPVPAAPSSAAPAAQGGTRPVQVAGQVEVQPASPALPAQIEIQPASPAAQPQDAAQVIVQPTSPLVKKHVTVVPADDQPTPFAGGVHPDSVPAHPSEGLWHVLSSQEDPGHDGHDGHDSHDGHDGAAGRPACPRIWGSVEALFWWVKGAPVVPLVTMNHDPNSIASLSEPGTVVLFGNQPIDFRNTTGVRGTIGGWIVDNCAGIEGSIFGLAKQGNTFTATAAGENGPVIAVPINSTVPFNFQPAGETTFNPGNVPSVITVNSTTQLFGAEVLGLANLVRGCHGYLNLLGGFEYLDLREGVSIDQTFFDTKAPGFLNVHDAFTSRNHFYGAGIGLRGGVQWHFVGFELTGKVAVGTSQEQYSAQGSSSATPGAFGLAGITVPAGALVQPSNTGSFSRNEVAFMPQGQAKVTFDVLRNVRLFAAFDFLYISNVVRASNQIEHVINPTQNPIFSTANGAPAPVPTFNQTDFWATGVSAGLEFRY
jgi:hypothetical protein